MDEVLVDYYPTINDLPDEIIIKIILIVLFSNPNIKLKSLYINRIFHKLIKKNIYILPPNLKKEVHIQIPKPYSYICNKFAKNLLLKSVVIQNSVTHIGHHAFSCCESLISIVLSNSVTHIADYAFSCCESLTSIVLPNSVTHIGHYAFSCCKSLTSIVLPNSVTHIGMCAFSCCESLTSIVIPNSVTFIGHSAFSWCDLLTFVKMPRSLEHLKSKIFTFYFLKSKNFIGTITYT